jgi:hypothetical protein
MAECVKPLRNTEMPKGFGFDRLGLWLIYMERFLVAKACQT